MYANAARLTKANAVYVVVVGVVVSCWVLARLQVKLGAVARRQSEQVARVLDAHAHAQLVDTRALEVELAFDAQPAHVARVAVHLERLRKRVPELASTPKKRDMPSPSAKLTTVGGRCVYH